MKKSRKMKNKQIKKKRENKKKWISKYKYIQNQQIRCKLTSKTKKQKHT